MKLIVNCETNEITEVNLTDEEIADREEAAKNALDLETTVKNKESAKMALLDKMGITSEEAKLLLS